MSLPQLPTLAETSGSAVTLISEALEEDDAEMMLLPKDMRNKAHGFIANIGWHVSATSAVIGDSNTAPLLLKCSPGDLSIFELEKMWKVVLSEASELAIVTKASNPRLAGAMETSDKNKVINDLMNEGLLTTDIGSAGMPVRGLSEAQIHGFSKHLALFSVFMNNRYKNSFAQSKAPAREVPFPANLAKASKEVIVNHIFTMLYHLEFADPKRKTSVVLGEMARFMWAYCLQADEDYKVTGFTAPSTVAKALNALIAIIKYCILWFRCRDKEQDGIDKHKVTFQNADSAALLTTLRSSIDCELGKERNQRVYKNIDESARLRTTVITVTTPNNPSKDFTALDLGAGYNRAVVDLRSLSKEVLVALGISEDAASRLVNHLDPDIIFDTTKGDIRCLKMPFEDMVDTAQLTGRLRDKAAMLDNEQLFDIESKLHRIQRAILFCVYFNNMGASRSTDMYFTSPLASTHDDAPRTWKEGGSEVFDVYHSSAATARTVIINMGNHKKKKENPMAGIGRTYDACVSRFLSLWCIFSGVIFQKDDHSFHGIWQFSSRDQLREAFPVACQEYLGFFLRLSDARQVQESVDE